MLVSDDDIHFYEPAKGHGLRHDPFNAIVGPRPIGWISTVDLEGRRNLAPYSFFNAFAYRPPIIGFSSTLKKDTLTNAAATGEFVWNLATMAQAEAMNITSTAAPPEVDEFVLAGLDALPSRLVRAPRVAGSPVSFECRTTQQLQLVGVDGVPADAWVTFGQVMAVHIHRSLLVDGVYQTAAAHPILRTGGIGGYVEITPEAAFDMPRPATAHRAE